MTSAIVLLLMLIAAYVVGALLERRHYRSIVAREDALLHIPAVATRTLPPGETVVEAQLVWGAVVVSVDYFKRLLAGLRKFFGGELTAYSSLIDRGRREALLRMKASAPDAHYFLNCRIETSTIYSGKQNRISGVEVCAYATAVTFARCGPASQGLTQRPV